MSEDVQYCFNTPDKFYGQKIFPGEDSSENVTSYAKRS